MSAFRILDVRLEATVADHQKGPRALLPQVAFAGRSNVGKSSMLNAIFRLNLAGVSKQPGKTRTINYYRVNDACYFVDLPGYGFARASQADRARWGGRITAYLVSESRLRLVVGLIDPRVPTSPLDVDMARFVRAAGRGLLVVMTKADTLGRGALAQAAWRLQGDLDLETKPLAFSARTGSGVKETLAAIAEALAA